MSRRATAVPAAFAICLLWLLGPGSAGPAQAEPAFAVRTGYRCSQCHVNRSGGGLRTPFGSLYTQVTLPRQQLKWREAGNLLPADPDARFAFGANLRAQLLHVSRNEQPDTTSFEVPEANLYVEARVLPGRVSVYLDETVGPQGSGAREIFGLVSFGEKKWHGYVKAGKFLPSYGWRLPDDDAFIRKGTGFTYSLPDNGVEVGLEPGRWSLQMAAVNGNGGSDNNESKKFVLQAVRRFRNWRVGVSGSNDIGGGVTSTRAGALFGANFGRLSLLGEADWAESSLATGTQDSLFAFIEGNILISRGLNLKISHDWTDPDRDAFDSDAEVRDSIGIEFIPYPFVQLRAFARRLDGPPQVLTSEDLQFELELHIFF
jgi:hypothetical protein